MPSVLVTLALLPGLLLADLVVPPGPFRHEDAIRTLAEMHAVVLVASARCPDLFGSTEIDGLQAALGLTGADSPEALALVRKLVADMDAAASKAGAPSWCDEAYGRFGPYGTMMKGLLKRCDPRSSGC